MVPLVIAAWREMYIDYPSSLRRLPEYNITMHRAILDALRQRDIAAAREAMHFDFMPEDSLV